MNIEIKAEELWDEYSEYIGDDITSLDSVAGSSVIKSRRSFLKSTMELCAPLQSHIANLEAQNKELVELLSRAYEVIDVVGNTRLVEDIGKAIK